MNTDELNLIKTLQPTMGLSAKILANKLQISVKKTNILLNNLKNEDMVVFYKFEGFWRVTHKCLVFLEKC